MPNSVVSSSQTRPWSLPAGWFSVSQTWSLWNPKNCSPQPCPLLGLCKSPWLHRIRSIHLPRLSSAAHRRRDLQTGSSALGRVEIRGSVRSESHRHHGMCRQGCQFLVLPDDKPNVCQPSADCWCFCLHRCPRMFQLQKNKDLQQQCLNLEGEVENMWNQGNARISSLTAKMKGTPNMFAMSPWAFGC